MSNVLTLIEVSASGKLASSKGSLLTAARRVGDPVAVVAVAPGGGQAVVDALGELGVTYGKMVATPQLAALAAAVETAKPIAVLAENTIDGREVAARLAVRLESGLLVDAVDLRADGDSIVTTHSIFGGAYNVESTVDGSMPIITVRQGVIDAEDVAATTPTTTALTLDIADEAGAVIDSISEAVVASDRPELRGAKTVVSGGRGLGSKERISALTGKLSR